MKQHNDVGRAVRDHLTALLPVLRGLDGVGQVADGSLPVSSPAMALQMAGAGLTGLLDLAADRISGTSALVLADAPAIERRVRIQTLTRHLLEYDLRVSSPVKNHIWAGKGHLQ